MTMTMATNAFLRNGAAGSSTPWPTPGAAAPPPPGSAGPYRRVDMNVEMGLGDMMEQQKQDRLGNLFALVVVADYLENAYTAGSVPDEQYDSEAKRLIGQFQTAFQSIKTEAPSFDLPSFMAQYQMSSTAGCNLLLKGVTAIDKLRAQKATPASANYRTTAHAVQCFITLLDAISLDRRATDEVQPHVSDLVMAVNAARDLLPASYDRDRVGRWLTLLNGMRAREELTDDQLRQMKFDVDTAYHEFKESLGNHGGA